MLIINKKLSKKGFSLIELMVAVVILAIAVLGIFLAFSSGWMGMANARDRTVATNYAREAMENVKNMDFEKIITTTKSVTNASKKYRIDVNVLLEAPNLKKVLTVVSWEDRKGISKTVDTTMLVQYLEVFASDPAKIVLFAESYNILNTPTDSVYATTGLTAVIKDINGNTIIDWGEGPGEGKITFLITSTDNFGTFSNDSISIEVEPINGRANTTFTSDGTMSGIFGLNVIEASVDLPPPAAKTVTDTTTIKITNGPVKIKLEADPLAIKASTTNSSSITASLIDATGQTLMKKNIFNDVEISLSVFEEGILSASTITIPYITGGTEGDKDASATVTLNSTGNPGLVNVVATSDNLESGKIGVKFLGPPVAISISANPNPMYLDDNYSKISVSLLDINGFNTSPTDSPITISLALTSNDTGGNLAEPSSWLFSPSDLEGGIKETNFSGQSEAGTAATITATASAGGLTAVSVTINVISSLTPDHIKLTPTHQIIPKGGTSTIKAIVYDISGKIVSNYAGWITFTKDPTSFGTFYGDNPVYTDNGRAEIALSSDISGTATIEASLEFDSILKESIEAAVVEFYGESQHIELSPESVNIVIGNSSTITATVCDSMGIHVPVYSGDITFTKDPTSFGTFYGDNPVYTTNGIATIELFSDAVGTATITALGEGDISSNNTSKVEFYEETTIELVEDSAKYYPADLEVVFAVKAIGEDILIDSMGISWEPNAATERFQKIVINSEEVYTGNSLSGAIVDVVDKTLVAGDIYSVELTFGKDVEEKEFIVTFYPYLGSYPVSFSPITQ